MLIPCVPSTVPTEVMAAVIVGGLVWSAFFTIPVSVSGQGILLSSGGVADVVADAGGQVHELVVAPGSMVSADMIIARIAQPDVALELTRGISDHHFIHSIYLRDPNGYVIELTAKMTNHAEATDPAQNDARGKLDRWQTQKRSRAAS